MDMQTLVVAALVPACAVYAVWVLMPSAWRRGLAARLARLSWPAPIARLLTREAVASPACRCDSCEQSALAPRATPQAVVTLHRKRKDAT